MEYYDVLWSDYNLAVVYIHAYIYCKLSVTPHTKGNRNVTCNARYNVSNTIAACYHDVAILHSSQIPPKILRYIIPSIQTLHPLNLLVASQYWYPSINTAALLSPFILTSIRWPHRGQLPIQRRDNIHLHQ